MKQYNAIAKPSSALSSYQHLTYSRRDIEEFEDTKREFRINP
jgi:hypothetical protein